MGKRKKPTATKKKKTNKNAYKSHTGRNTQLYYNGQGQLGPWQQEKSKDKGKS